MKRNNRWMKWVLETSADDVAMPWARGERRNAFKIASAKRARAA